MRIVASREWQSLFSLVPLSVSSPALAKDTLDFLSDLATEFLSQKPLNRFVGFQTLAVFLSTARTAHRAFVSLAPPLLSLLRASFSCVHEGLRPEYIGQILQLLPLIAPSAPKPSLELAPELALLRALLEPLLEWSKSDPSLAEALVPLLDLHPHLALKDLVDALLTQLLAHESNAEGLDESASQPSTKRRRLNFDDAMELEAPAPRLSVCEKFAKSLQPPHFPADQRTAWVEVCPFLSSPFPSVLPLPSPLSELIECSVCP